MINYSFVYLLNLSFFSGIGWVDLLAGVFIFLGLIQGLRKGLETELPKLISVMTASVVAFHFYRMLSFLLQIYFSFYPAFSNVISYVALFTGLLLVMIVLFKLLKFIVSFKFATPVSRLGGAVSGVLRATVSFVVLSFVLLMMPFDFVLQSYSSDRSLTGTFFAQVGQTLDRLTYYVVPSG